MSFGYEYDDDDERRIMGWKRQDKERGSAALSIAIACSFSFFFEDLSSSICFFFHIFFY